MYVTTWTGLNDDWSMNSYNYMGWSSASNGTYGRIGLSEYAFIEGGILGSPDILLDSYIISSDGQKCNSYDSVDVSHGSTKMSLNVRLICVSQ